MENKDLDISEAMKLWNIRLADDCIYRIATGCKHLLGKGQCNIIICPILGEAQLQIIYQFRDNEEEE